MRQKQNKGYEELKLQALLNIGLKLKNRQQIF